VHRSQPHLRQRDAGEQGRISHRGAAIAGFRFDAFPGREKAFLEGRHPAPGQGVGERVRLDRNIGFQQLRERIHAVGRDQFARAARQQVGIDHRVFGDQALVAERLLIGSLEIG